MSGALSQFFSFCFHCCWKILLVLSTLPDSKLLTKKQITWALKIWFN